MIRFVTSSPAFVEAHVKAERATHDLDASIRAAFARCDELEGRLRAFDGRLNRSKAYLREAGCLDNDRLRPDFPRSRGEAGLLNPNRRHRSPNRRDDHCGRVIGNHRTGVPA